MDSVYDLYRRGCDLLNHGDYQAAIVPLGRAREREPSASGLRIAVRTYRPPPVRAFARCDTCLQSRRGPRSPVSGSRHASRHVSPPPSVH